MLLAVDWAKLASVPPVTVMSLAVKPITFSENVNVMVATKPVAIVLRSEVTTTVGEILSLAEVAVSYTHLTLPTKRIV